jgi:hypothetical protein
MLSQSLSRDICLSLSGDYLEQWTVRPLLLVLLGVCVEEIITIATTCRMILIEHLIYKGRGTYSGIMLIPNFMKICHLVWKVFSGDEHRCEHLYLGYKTIFTFKINKPVLILSSRTSARHNSPAYTVIRLYLDNGDKFSFMKIACDCLVLVQLIW